MKNNVKSSLIEALITQIIDEARAKSVKKRKYKGKTYKASKSLTDAPTWDEKVRRAKKWSDNPEAAAAAATIVKTGKPPGKD